MYDGICRPGQGDWTVSVSIYISSCIYDNTTYLRNICAQKVAVGADKDVWYRCWRLIVLAFCIHSSRGYYECQGSSLNYPPLPIPTVTLQHLHWLELQLQGALIFPEPMTPFTLPLSIFFFFFIFDVDISPEFSTGSKYVWSWLWYIDILINCRKCNIFGYFLLVFLVHVVNIFSVTSKVYNKLRYQTDNCSGDEKLCCNVSFSP